MSTVNQKLIAAKAALTYINPDAILGMGTGSTVNFLLELLPTLDNPNLRVVASSKLTAQRLVELGFKPLLPNEVTTIDLYIDGADEINGALQMIKGGGAALTGEKILASLAEKFICIAETRKRVAQLGKFPLPIEVIPMAQGVVSRTITKLGGVPVRREGVITDYGNVILDVSQLELAEPELMEKTINQIPGVVTNGLFALRKADLLLLGTDNGVRIEN